MSDSELDENNKVYPSVDGLVHQTVDALESSNDFSWYSFKRPVFGPGNEVLVEAILVIRDGEEDKFYWVEISIEGQK